MMPDQITHSNALLLVVSGPAGSGKTTLCDRMLASFPSLSRIVTATTRQPREGEVDGQDYFFLRESEFEAMLAQNAFYEHARVHGRLYGTLKREVIASLEAGRDLMLNIDVQGAATIRERVMADTEVSVNLVSVFIQPPSIETIRERLQARSTDSPEEIERRIASAIEEMSKADLFDYILPTRSRDEDFQLLSSIYKAEKMRVRTSTIGARVSEKS
jgi:guanylate kinase